MQLVAYGAQDIYLTGNPQITFFKVVYRRHTNFSMEAILQTFNGTVATGGSNVTSTISRNGDLVSKLWLEVDLTVAAATGASYSALTNNTGHAFVKECEIEIGGQRIDRHYSQWLDIWNELTDHDEQEWVGLNKHGGKDAYLKRTTLGTDVHRLYVPLQFWFCRNPGLALPLIALQYHEVKLKLTTRNALALVNTDGTAVSPTAVTCNLWADYIYLDTDERRRFAQVSHEYLIEQLQQDTGAMTASKKLNFNHPVKELIWVNKDSVAKSQGTTSITTNTAGAVLASGTTTYQLKLNGHDRFAARDFRYFTRTQVWEHHSGAGGLDSGTAAGAGKFDDSIGVYSFALKPEEHQPSGTCNFSRIDNAQLVSTTNTLADTIFAVNYNVLRIMSGMGGLAYSN